MQTFLPYPSFAASARVLDGPRLGKQRVETLQILRALLLPTYGWQRHPAVRMWRGHVPALTAYGLATTDEWTGRGGADSTRPQILEFAPEVDGRSQERLAEAGLLPAWIGDPAVHESHRSKLIAKAPEVYGPVFPGTPPDLDYVWPAAADVPAAERAHGLLVVRVPSLEPWREAGLLGLPVLGPRGATAAWLAQLRELEDHVVPGTDVGVAPDDDPGRLHLATVTGPAASATLDGVDHVAVAVESGGLAVARGDLPVPAELQNPRRCFRLPLHEPVADLLADATRRSRGIPRSAGSIPG